MRITGKVEKEFNRTLGTAYIELSNIKLSRPYKKAKFDFTTRQDERELFETLNAIPDLKIYGDLPNFEVEVEDIVEVDGELEFVDGMWFMKSHKLIDVRKSPSHNKRLHDRFNQITHATIVEKW